MKSDKMSRLCLSSSVQESESISVLPERSKLSSLFLSDIYLLLLPEVKPQNPTHIKHEVGQASGVTQKHLLCTIVCRQPVECVAKPHPGGTFPGAAVPLTLKLCLHEEQKAKVQSSSSFHHDGGRGRELSASLRC